MGDRPNTRTWRRVGYELVKAEPGRSVIFRRLGLPAAGSSSTSRCLPHLARLLRPRLHVATDTLSYPVRSGPGELGAMPAILEILQCRSLKFPGWLRPQRVLAEVSG